MLKYKDYEKYFTDLGITEKEANSLLKFMEELAEISINKLNEKIFEDEKLCDLDESEH